MKFGSLNSRPLGFDNIQLYHLYKYTFYTKCQLFTPPRYEKKLYRFLDWI